LILVLALIFPACVRSASASFANPCEHPVRILTYRVPPAEIERDQRVADVELPPLEVTKVETAFDEAVGTSWSVVVEGLDRPISVDGATWEDDTVIVPAEACEVD
jgi:hypothetical protein